MQRGYTRVGSRALGLLLLRSGSPLTALPEDWGPRLYGTFTGPLRISNKGMTSLVMHQRAAGFIFPPSFPLLAAALGAAWSGPGWLPAGQM